MSKSSSYFDWELAFRKGHYSSKKVKIDMELINSIGIPISKYKKFLKEWKEKNLS
ncbi:MAG: hypothetical protein ACTSQU_11925 [Promethearchaeota archaeon]